MRDLSQLRLDLRAKVGHPNLVDVPDEVLTRFVNEAYQEIGTKYAFHETRCIASMETVAGTARYNLPTDLVALRKVWDNTRGRPIRKAGVSALTNRGPAAYRHQDAPIMYVRAGKYIELIPAPSAPHTIYLYYNTQVQALVDDTDSTVLPSPWEPGIILLARYKFFDEKGDIAKAQYSYNAYKLWLADKPQEIDMEKVDMDSAVEIPQLRHGYTYRGWDSDTIYNDCWRHSI